MENQQVEYRESWRDDNLKMICAFANAEGGTLYVGRDDVGHVVGVRDIKKLLEDVPNKIQSGLGILASVNSRQNSAGLEYLEINVPSSTFPINYDGAYYCRSGSTTQLLTGIALQDFLMRTTGYRWEEATVDGIDVEDLDAESLNIFRREALKRKRMSAEELDVPDAELLHRLHLMTGDKLKRSAVLLFYDDPAVVRNGIRIQIGKFGDGPDLLYQDVLENSLIKSADRVIELIYLKYLKAKVTFENDKRMETYPYARAAVREAVYNAIAHSCYMYGTPIQIRIEDRQMIISNRCVLPNGWTTETLMEPHESIPYNPDIANVFYRAGYIENWGRGVEKICDACADLGVAPPVYELRESSLRVRFAALEEALIDESRTATPGETTNANGATATIDYVNVQMKERKLTERIMDLIRSDASTTIQRMAEVLGASTYAVKKGLRELRSDGCIARKDGRQRGPWEINEERLRSSQLDFESLDSTACDDGTVRKGDGKTDHPTAKWVE